MSDEKEHMNTKLEEMVIPVLRIAGFQGSLPHFRRIKEAEIDLLTFQTDRYGGGFVIEIAKTENKTFITHWGKEIEPKKITAFDITKRIRIHPKGILKDSSTDDWFRYDKKVVPFQDRYTIVAMQVIKQITTIEEIFKNNLLEWNKLIED